jgi:hypothetical protein
MNEEEIRTELFHLRKRINLSTGMNRECLYRDEEELLSLLKEFTDERL